MGNNAIFNYLFHFARDPRQGYKRAAFFGNTNTNCRTVLVRKKLCALRKKSPAVVEEAIRVLGGMKSEKAVDQLIRLYRSNRKLGENENLFALLLKEIGRQGHKKAIKPLADHPFRYLTRDVGKARLMGLGNIRHRDAVDALVKAGQKAGGRGAGGVDSQWRGVFTKDNANDIKAKLIENTNAAVARGVFGIPTFFVGDEMFFGKERLGQVEEEIMRG